MNSFWKIFILLLVNVLVSVGATLATLYYWENFHSREIPVKLETAIESIPLSATDRKPAETLLPGSTNTPEPTFTSTIKITETQASAAVPPIRGALVDIPLVTGAGNISAESVRIESTSDTAVSLNRWTIEDADGHIFTFPDIQILRKGMFIEIYTRSGHNTPYELYWNLDEPVWQSGETVVLKDKDGNTQAVYRIP